MIRHSNHVQVVDIAALKDRKSSSAVYLKLGILSSYPRDQIALNEYTAVQSYPLPRVSIHIPISPSTAVLYKLPSPPQKRIRTLESFCGSSMSTIEATVCL